ncbi:MAG TPA: HIG1 domain-containing protein [Burkholderiales bacterium]|nr:HIG1 domain-containing protein [Burkholderiales bacterium]
MNLLTMLVLVATFATIASLATGVVSMAYDDGIAHRSSAQWMVWRVVLQAAAIAMILLALADWN